MKIRNKIKYFSFKKCDVLLKKFDFVGALLKGLMANGNKIR